MTQFKAILERLKNPSVILSIVSQVITILIAFKVNVNVDLVTGVAVSICSVLVLLGIMSNPTTKNPGFGDDILQCKTCKEPTVHVKVADKMLCSKCGAEFSDEEINNAPK